MSEWEKDFSAGERQTQRHAVFPKVLAMYTQPGQWFRTSHFAEALGTTTGAASQMARRLKQAGELHMIGLGCYVRYYRTAEEAQAGRADYVAERAKALHESKERERERHRSRRTGNPTGRPKRSQQHAMATLIDGMTSPELAIAAKWSNHTARHALWQLTLDGRAFVLHRGPQPAIYFHTTEARDAAKAEWERGITERSLTQREIREAAKKGVPRPKKPKKPKTGKELLSKACMPAREKSQSLAPARMAGEAYIPPTVQVQRLPGFERFGDPHRARWAMT